MSDKYLRLPRDESEIDNLIVNQTRFKKLKENNFICLCSIATNPINCFCDTFRETGECKCKVWIR